MNQLQQRKSASAVGKSVLIVEDDDALNFLLQEIFQDETPYQVYCAQNGTEALTQLDTVTPQLFLVDYHLPGMNGIELAQQIQHIAGYEQIPILLLSADLPPAYYNNYHVTQVKKPFDLDELLNLVTTLLR
ncbi:MAG TPA: response regulator [Ktedonobacteraceae bacterium]|nr:response regulator [Ktedonobacteraceae bacterium]